MKIYVVFVLLILAACQPIENDGRLSVVSTTGMINDIVINIGGEKVNAIGLMGPGVDPHLYKASEGDVRKLSNADIIFYNGLHLEARMGEVLEQMDNKAYAVTTSIPEEQLRGWPAYPDQKDPHVWFNVEHWMKATEVVRDTLIMKDPDNKEFYESNAEKYLTELSQLHEYVIEKSAQVPEQQRVLITAHDAFAYFGDAYGFEVRGLQGISTASEPGTEDVQSLVDFIVENEINAIFIESSIPERNVKAVQEAAKSRGWDVAIGGELFSDAMGDAGTEEGTYQGMVKHNIDTITGALS